MLTATLLRTLKGCPLSVLMALALAGGPVSAEWIERTTGYSDKTVGSALQFLLENQFCTRNERYGWQIAAGMMQLPLVTPELPEPPAAAPAEPTAVEKDPENFRVGEFPTPTSLVVVVNPESSTREENLATSQNDPEKFRVEQNLAECDAWGIREPARSELAKLAHVRVELIRAHCKNCKNMGQAIYRIRRDWAAPVEKPETTLPVASEIEGDDETADVVATDWWKILAERISELMPRAEFLSYVPRSAPAWRDGPSLVVVVGNPMVEEVILKHISRAELNNLVKEISQDSAQILKFERS